MPRLAWYKRYPADFREGTRKLSFEERGFYGDVLDLIYESGNELLDDDAANAHQLHAELRTFRRLKARLVELGKLYLADGMVRNARADAEASTAASRIALAREHAKLGGEKSRKSVAKSSDFNGSGGAGAQAGAEAGAEAPSREESDRRIQKKETHAAASSLSPARAREETAPAAPAAAADSDFLISQVMAQEGCGFPEALALLGELGQAAGGDLDLVACQVRNAIRKAGVRSWFAYARGGILGEVRERQRPAPPPEPYVDVLETAKRMARDEGLYDLAPQGNA